MSSPYPPAGGSGYGAPPPGQYAQQQQYGAPQQGYGQQQGYGGGAPAYGSAPGGYAPPQGQYGDGGQGYGHQQQQSGYPPQGVQGGYPPQGGQYGGAPQHGGTNPQQLQQWFQSVDLDRSGAITVQELKQALVNGDWTPFSDETVKMLLDMFDTDRSGTIGMAEFSGLWSYIKEWQDTFRRFDIDRSGTIQPQELHNALATFGYNVSPRTIHLLAAKHNPPPVIKPGMHGSNAPPALTFDRFVRCCVSVRHLTEAFKRADVQGTGYVNMGYEQFMDIVLSAP